MNWEYIDTWFDQFLWLSTIVIDETTFSERGSEEQERKKIGGKKEIVRKKIGKEIERIGRDKCWSQRHVLRWRRQRERVRVREEKDR